MHDKATSDVLFWLTVIITVQYKMKGTLRSRLYLGNQNKKTSIHYVAGNKKKVIIRQEINKDRKVTSFNLSRVAKALELACSLGFPKILLNMDMATTLATETQQHLR
jgi:hypothetical protein